MIGVRAAPVALLSSILGVALLVSSAAAGASLSSCELNSAAVEDGPRDGIIVFRVTIKSLTPIELRVCIEDARGFKIHDHGLTISGPATTWEHRVAVPTGTYSTVTSISSNGGKARGGGTVDLLSCATKAMIVPSSASDGPSYQGTQMLCESPRGPEGIAPNQEDPPQPLAERIFFGTDSIESPIAWGMLVPSLGLVALVAWPRGRYLLLGLFTRVHGPAVLEQETRAEIYQLIRQDPGVNAHRIANNLGLGSGETRYHLGVLRRNRLVCEVRRGSLRCFFVAASASPAALRATAVLRTDAVERLYDAVLANPDETLTSLADIAGLRLSRASKALRKLVDGQLVERVQDGRMIRVRATDLRPFLPAFEANPSSEAAAVS